MIIIKLVIQVSFNQSMSTKLNLCFITQINCPPSLISLRKETEMLIDANCVHAAAMQTCESECVCVCVSPPFLRCCSTSSSKTVNLSSWLVRRLHRKCLLSYCYACSDHSLVLTWLIKMERVQVRSQCQPCADRLPPGLFSFQRWRRLRAVGDSDVSLCPPRPQRIKEVHFTVR